MTDMHLNDEAPIQIEWADFQPMLELICKPRNDVLLGGVYAWGFEVDGIFLLWYVGKANARTSVQTRLRDHFMLLIGGSYTIPSCFFNEGEAFDLQKPSTAMISWDLDHDFPHSKMLHDLSTLIPITTAGHKFASQILASIGRVISDDSPGLNESPLLKLVESKLIEAIRQVLELEERSPDFGTFAHLVRTYFDSPRYKNLAPRTRTDYTEYSKHVLAVFGNLDPSSITAPHISRYINVERKDAPVRANREKSFMSAAFRLGIELGWCKENPARMVKSHMELPRNRRPEAW